LVKIFIAAVYPNQGPEFAGGVKIEYGGIEPPGQRPKIDDPERLGYIGHQVYPGKVLLAGLCLHACTAEQANKQE